MTLRRLLACESTIRNTSLLAMVVALLCPLPAWTAARTVIPVADEAELYAAVNKRSNAGALVLLAAGTTYRLDASYPNGGRLDLQPGMALQGVVGNRESAVIDASDLPAASYSIPPYATGAIRIGRGNNSVEWLTVRNAVNAASAIATDLVSSKSARVRVAHVLAIDNVRGLDVRNIGPASEGRELEVDIEDNWFTGHSSGAGQGLRIINLDAPEARIRATLRNNQSYGNLIGCISANLNTTGARIEIQSSGDRFERNGNGCVFIAGLTQATATTLAVGNRLSVQMKDGSLSHNTGTLPPAFPVPGGMLAIGGQSLGAGNRAFDNALEVTLHDVVLRGNQGPGIHAFGAVSAAATPAGTGNSVYLDLLGSSARTAVFETPSEPPEPAGTNTIDIDR